MELTDLEHLFKTRRSIRLYQQRDVPDELLRQAIEIAAYAPTGGNRQSYRFVVVKRRAVIEAIADAVQAKAALMASWPEAREFGDTVERWQTNSAFFRDAPVLIAALVGNYASTADFLMTARGEADPEATEMMAARRFGSTRIQSVAATIGYLLLVLHQMGLGAVYMTGPLQAKREIEAILGVGADMQFAALVPVGYPAEEKGIGTRKPVDEVMEIVR